MTLMPLHQAPPFNVDDLLHLRAIEGSRVEFKANFGDINEYQVLRTVSAFANDLLNLNGGYLVLGVEEVGGRPVLPPVGLDPTKIDDIQKKVFELCHSITPSYQPLVFPVVFDSKEIIVIWAPGGDNRPYQASGKKNKGDIDYYVRLGAVTSAARGDTLRQLLEQTAKIPFDDRRNLSARVEDISPILVRRFLADVRSDLVSEGLQVDDFELYRRLRLLAPVNGHHVPRNFSLLFFNENPDREDLFRGARIEVVQFGDGAGGDLIEERTFRGPIPTQIKSTLEYLEGIGGRLLQKSGKVAEVERTVAYPYAALEEAIVNAVYHRSYEGNPEPTKIYLYPDRLEITSYPGPVAGLMPEHLAGTQVPPSVPARNRRIGELLKELRLCESRGTGVPKIRRKMAENGSPEPKFEFDEQRTYFRVVLPVHPRYQILHALREAAHLWATGAKSEAVMHLERARDSQPSSGALVSQIIEYSFAIEDETRARSALANFEGQQTKIDATRPFLTIARLLLDRRKDADARAILDRLPPNRSYEEILDAALLRKRGRDYQGAHRLFVEAYSIHPQDPKLLHEFAQTKMKLSEDQNPTNPRGREIRRRLANEAADLLRSAIQISGSDMRAAWCWFNLAKVLSWQRQPISEIEGAYLKAISLAPEEGRFSEGYDSWRAREGRH